MGRSKDNEENKQEQRMIDRFVFGVIFVLIIAIVFKVIDCFIANELKISDAFQFYGAFSGAAIGTLGSLCVLYITLEKQKANFEQQRSIDNKNREEDLLNSFRPILKLNKFFISNFEGNEIPCKDFEVYNKINDNTMAIIISNIGTGPARNIDLKIEEKNLIRSIGHIDKFDLGVNDKEYLIIKYPSSIVKVDDFKQHIRLYISCRDIFNKKKYEYTFLLSGCPEGQGIDIFECIEERTVDIV